MNRPQSSSSKRYAGYVLAGCMLMEADCLALLVLSAIHPMEGVSRWLRMVALLPFLGGMLLAAIGELRLSKGIKAGAWAGEELALIKARVTGRAWIWMACVPVCVWLGVFFTHRTGIVGFFLAVWPLQVLFRLQRTMAPPYIVSEERVVPSSFSSARSDHWGEMPRSVGTE